MNQRERAEYVADGLSPNRRDLFLVSEQVSHQWRDRHPWTLDDYFRFLEDLQDMFGPFAQRDETWIGNDFRL